MALRTSREFQGSGLVADWPSSNRDLTNTSYQKRRCRLSADHSLRPDCLSILLLLCVSQKAALRFDTVCFCGFNFDRLFALLRSVTAINREGLSGNERCAVGTEPAHGASDLFRLADASDGNRGLQTLLYFRRTREVAKHSRLNRPGSHGIDAHMLFGVFQRNRFGQPDDGVLLQRRPEPWQSLTVPRRKSC